MAFVLIGVWFGGLAAVGLLGELARAERAWVVALARAGFTAGLALSLLATAGLLAGGGSNPLPRFQPDRLGWWVLSFACALPVLLANAAVVWPAYRGRRFALAAATGWAVALYAAMPLAFEPADRPLRGLASWAHREHALVLSALLVPALVLVLFEAPAVARGAR